MIQLFEEIFEGLGPMQIVLFVLILLALTRMALCVLAFFYGFFIADIVENVWAFIKEFLLGCIDGYEKAKRAAPLVRRGEEEPMAEKVLKTILWSLAAVLLIATIITYWVIFPL